MKKLLALMLLASPCFANTTVSLMLGGAFPTGRAEVSGASDDNAGNAGGAFGAQVMVPIDQTWSVGVDLLGTAFGERTSDKLLAPAPATTVYQVKTGTFLVGARAQSKSLIGDKIQPYLFGGIGFHHTSAWADVSPQRGFVWTDTGTAEKRRALDDSSTGFAAAAAVGADIPLSTVVSFGLEGRYQYLSQSKFSTKSISTIAPTATEVKIEPSSVDLLARLSFHF